MTSIHAQFRNIQNPYNSSIMFASLIYFYGGYKGCYLNH